VVQAVAETDSEKVFAWAMEHFLDLGFSEQQSETLANDGAGWWEAKKLLDKGCTTNFAFEILRT